MVIAGDRGEGIAEEARWEETKEDDAEKADQKGDGKDEKRHIENHNASGS